MSNFDLQHINDLAKALNKAHSGQSLLGIKGDPLIDEFTALISGYAGEIMQYYAANTTRCDWENLAQDVVLAALEKFGQFHGSVTHSDSEKGAEAKFTSWFSSICRNEFLSDRKNKHVRKTCTDTANVGEGTTGLILQNLQDRDENVVEKMIAQEGRRELLQLIHKRLSPQHAAILDLRFFQGLKYEDIASSLEVPIGTVRSRLHKAKVALLSEIELQESKIGSCSFR